MRSKRQGNRAKATGNGIFDLFKSKVTYKPAATKSALSSAYKAGEKSGDTGDFDNWWSRYSGKSGVDKQKIKREYERGVEGQPSTKKVVSKKAVGIRGKYRGCNIYYDPDNKDYFGSCDRDSKFDSYNDTKQHIDWLKKGREENPDSEVEVSLDPNEGWSVKVDGKVIKSFAFGTPGRKLAYAFAKQQKLKNPSTRSSKEITEGFHGRESTEETEILEEEIYQDELAGLGLLCELEICDSEDSDKVVPITFNYSKPEEAVYLACDRDGNIEFVGGDQDLELEKLGIETNGHQKVKLGYVATISYYADKHHLEGPKYQANGTEYVHEFGEEDGEMPCLIYDLRNRKMELVGGSYTVTDEGIRN